MIFIKSEIDSNIGEAIHYPKCWDTMAYPTLATALWEMVNMPLDHKCPTCNKRQRLKSK